MAMFKVAEYDMEIIGENLYGKMVVESADGKSKITFKGMDS